MKEISVAHGTPVSLTRIETLLDQVDTKLWDDTATLVGAVWRQLFPRGRVVNSAVSELSKRNLPALLLLSNQEICLASSLRKGKVYVRSHSGDETPVDNDVSECRALTFETGEDLLNDGSGEALAVDSADWFRAAFRSHGQ